MEKVYQLMLLILCLTTCHASPVPNPGIFGMEEGMTEPFLEDVERNMEELDSDDIERGDEVDLRLKQKYPDYSIDPYACSSDLQCPNGGKCVATQVGNICNCTQNYLGPYCDYSASSIEQALRIHPTFKISFAECMTKTGKNAGIDAAKILSKCGGGQNLCWLEEGGIKGLKCFYWCLTNGMHLSLSEAKPSEESRLQLYAEVFQKLASERHLPERPPVNRPSGVPIYSMQISLYDTSQNNYPYPSHNTFGLQEISIKPSVSFWANPNYGPSPYAPVEPQPYNSPYAPNKQDPRRGPHPQINPPYEYPRSHEIPSSGPDMEGQGMGPVRPSSLEEYLENLPRNPGPYGTFPEEQQDPSPDVAPENFPGYPGNNFLSDALQGVIFDISNHNVVESDDSEEETSGDDMFPPEFSPYQEFPFHDPFSNMRGAPQVEGD